MRLTGWIGIAALLLSTAGRAEVQVGQPAPEFSGTDTQGRTHTLGEYRGQVVVLEWTNHDCPYVRKHYGTGNMQAQQREATARGVTWLSIISERSASEIRAPASSPASGRW